MKQTTIDLDNLLDSISVISPGMWDNENTNSLKEWYALTTDDGIIAYFNNEVDAFRFRLDLINRYLNP